MIAYLESSAALALYIEEPTSAVATGVKSFDALHLSSALILGGIGAEFLTFDRRQAVAARAVGLRVIGAN